jgi:hypothetical protein
MLAASVQEEFLGMLLNEIDFEALTTPPWVRLPTAVLMLSKKCIIVIWKPPCIGVCRIHI